MQTLPCACGAVLVIPPGAPSMVCATCMRTHVLASDPTDLGTADTMAAIQFDPKLVPMSRPPPDPIPVTKRGVDPSPAARPSMQVIETPLERPLPPARLTGHPERAVQFAAQRAKGRRSAWPLVIGLGVGAAIVIGAIAVVAMREERAAPPPVTAPIDAPPPDPAKRTSPELLIAAEHEAIAKADQLALQRLMRSTTFGFGADASDVREGPEGVARLIAEDLGPPPAEGFTVRSKLTSIAMYGDMAWIVDKIEVGAQLFVTSQVAVRDGGTWSVAAWHWAKLLPNKRAFELATTGKLQRPIALEDEPSTGGELEVAVREAFASRAALVDAISDRPDTIDIGSAPNEHHAGASAKRTFTSSKATLAIARGGVAVGRLSDATGWAALNVDLTVPSDDKPVTQTFRVLAALIKDQDRWQIVMLQWSNGGPF